VIAGLSHLTFVVRDLERMTRILTGIFGAREVYASGEQTFSVAREKFFQVGDLWIAVMEGEPLPSRTYNHVAFKIEDAEFEAYEAKIKAMGLEIRPPRQRATGEGRSLYFYDDDNHLFELHTGTLAERLERYTKGKGAK
jgi:catechol 2,3-dioxygenase-like lactoylglutathione lyase family enzyme